MKIKDVQKWVERSSVWKGETSKTNIDRAICAIAYLMKASGEAEQLFWSLYGIEALVAESNSATEIKRRIPLLLPGVDRKKISELYQYRSIIFHGKKNFRLPHYSDEDFETGDAEKRYKWVNYSQEILFGALQKLVRKNVRELSFKEKPVFKK